MRYFLSYVLNVALSIIFPDKLKHTCSQTIVKHAKETYKKLYEASWRHKKRNGILL